MRKYVFEGQEKLFYVSLIPKQQRKTSGGTKKKNQDRRHSTVKTGDP